MEVDLMLGGGIRRNAVTQLVGLPGAGKSTIAFHLVAESQRNGLRCAYLDVEGKVDADYATLLGVNPDELMYVDGATTAEQYLDVVKDFALGKDKADIIVYDSIVAAGARQEILNNDGTIRDLDSSTIAALPRVLSGFFRNRWNLIRRNGITLVCINQVRVQGIGTMFVTEGTTGGNALSHMTEDELHVNKVSSSPAMKWMFGTTTKAIGHGLRLSMKKAGSGGIQGRMLDSQFIYIDPASTLPEHDIASNLSLLHFGYQSGLITGRSRYTLPSGKTALGKNELYSMFCEDQESIEVIKSAYIRSRGIASTVLESEESENEEDVDI
jgi:RecA/RadA recombinase